MLCSNYFFLDGCGLEYSLLMTYLDGIISTRLHASVRERRFKDSHYKFEVFTTGVTIFLCTFQESEKARFGEMILLKRKTHFQDFWHCHNDLLATNYFQKRFFFSKDNQATFGQLYIIFVFVKMLRHITMFLNINYEIPDRVA